jgi:hypothetical protein
MTLTPPESRSFFKMYLPLLHYAYSSKHADVTFRQFKSLKIAEKISAQEVLFDTRLENDMTGIKRHVKGEFIVIRHLSKYSVFMEMNRRNKLYGVIGLSEELGDVLPFVPILINGVLFNFRNKLVCNKKASGRHRNLDDAEILEKGEAGKKNGSKKNKRRTC